MSEAARWQHSTRMAAKHCLVLGLLAMSICIGAQAEEAATQQITFLSDSSVSGAPCLADLAGTC